MIDVRRLSVPRLNSSLYRAKPPHLGPRDGYLPSATCQCLSIDRFSPLSMPLWLFLSLYSWYVCGRRNRNEIRRHFQQDLIPSDTSRTLFLLYSEGSPSNGCQLPACSVAMNLDWREPPTLYPRTDLSICRGPTLFGYPSLWNRWEDRIPLV